MTKTKQLGFMTIEVLKGSLVPGIINSFSKNGIFSCEEVFFGEI